LPPPTAQLQDTKHKCYSKECRTPITKYKFHRIRRPTKPPSHLPLDATSLTCTTKDGERAAANYSIIVPSHKQRPKEKLGVPYLRAVVSAPGFPPPPIAGAAYKGGRDCGFANGCTGQRFRLPNRLFLKRFLCEVNVTYFSQTMRFINNWILP
jgi:hypothetical protein